MLILSRELRQRPPIRNLYVAITSCLWLGSAVLLLDSQLREQLGFASGISSLNFDLLILVAFFFLGYGLLRGYWHSLMNVAQRVF